MFGSDMAASRQFRDTFAVRVESIPMLRFTVTRQGIGQRVFGRGYPGGLHAELIVNLLHCEPTGHLQPQVIP